MVCQFVQKTEWEPFDVLDETHVEDEDKIHRKRTTVHAGSWTIADYEVSPLQTSHSQTKNMSVSMNMNESRLKIED